MKRVSKTDSYDHLKPQYKKYIERFADIDQELLKTMENFDLDIESEESYEQRLEKTSLLRKQLEDMGARSRNDHKSLVWGPLSPACERCMTGERSISSFVSLACDRNCWFCFNPNQHDYEQFRIDKKDWLSELDELYNKLGGLDFIAFTGGEPLLFPNDTLEFIEYARNLSPHAHIRLYTSGAQVDPSFMKVLSDAGLDEIRFSIKIEEPKQKMETVFELIAAAKEFIPAVMVEMPVIPGTKQEMEDILVKLDEMDIFGINLLELCFPLHNAQEFRSRGLSLVRHPYQIPYSYGYAGALPISGSEELAYELMLSSIKKNSRLSLHWCSLENKNTAQVFGQNGGGLYDLLPYEFSSRSFFYETIRAFEDDAIFCRSIIENSDFYYETDEDCSMIAFQPSALKIFEPQDLEQHQIWLASAIIESEGNGKQRFREVGLALLDGNDMAIFDDSLFRDSTHE